MDCDFWFWFCISIIKFNSINHTIRFYKPYNTIIKTIFHIHPHIHVQMHKQLHMRIHIQKRNHPQSLALQAIQRFYTNKCMNIVRKTYVYDRFSSCQKMVKLRENAPRVVIPPLSKIACRPFKMRNRLCFVHGQIGPWLSVYRIRSIRHFKAF